MFSVSLYREVTQLWDLGQDTNFSGPRFPQVFPSEAPMLRSKELSEAVLLQISPGVSLRVTELLKVSLDSSSTFSNPQKL